LSKVWCSWLLYCSIRTTKKVNQGIDDVRLTQPLVLGYEFTAITECGEQDHSQSIRYNYQRAAQDAKPERE
jgi:hypothetical protein